MYGGDGDDVITDTQGLPGAPHGDGFFGEGGNDILIAGTDGDPNVMVGGEGADVLYGGPGDDVLVGGVETRISEGAASTIHDGSHASANTRHISASLERNDTARGHEASTG